MKFIDRKYNRLVFIEKKANSNYWDKHWDKQNLKYPKNIYPFDTVVRFTKKYLKKGSKILEGGCGLGQNVWKLNKSGFYTIGIDYADRTVNLIKKNYPKMEIILGDVNKLPFSKNEFDGYWSLGVIEHFYEGGVQFDHCRNGPCDKKWRLSLCHFSTHVSPAQNQSQARTLPRLGRNTRKH